MPRHTKVITITSEGRDLGKSFRLTELSSDAGEKWAHRALLALSRGGFELPEGIFEAGMAGLASIVPYLVVLGEQIARENAEELDKEVAKAVLDNGLIDDYRNGYIRGLRKAQDLQAAIARGEK